MTEENILFQEYINLDCLVKKAMLLKKIKAETRLPYVILSLELYEDSRTLKRIYKINDLIPEYKELLSERKIPKVVAYHLSSLNHEKQKEIYNLFLDRLLSWNSRDGLDNLKRVATCSQKANNELMNIVAARHEKRIEEIKQLNELEKEKSNTLNFEQLSLNFDEPQTSKAE